MGDISVINKKGYTLNTKISDQYSELEYTDTLDALYRWNTVASGSIPFGIVNIAYIESIDPITGDMKTHLTGINTSTSYKEISITDVGYNGNYGYKLECTGGIIRFIGKIDGVDTDIIISEGNGIEFNLSIEGKIYASVDPKTIGQFSYERYTCGSLYGSYAVKKMIEIDTYGDRPPSPGPEPTPIDPAQVTRVEYDNTTDSIHIWLSDQENYQEVPIANITNLLDYYTKNVEPDPDPEPTPDPDPEPTPEEDDVSSEEGGNDGIDGTE